MGQSNGFQLVDTDGSQNPSTGTVEEAVDRSVTTNDTTTESSGFNEPSSVASGESDQLPMDLIFGLLSNERRRQVLNYLNETGEETVLSDLAEQIASIENDKPVAAISSKERKRVYVGLYQIHLPKMDDADVIDYNQSRGTIELRPEADQLLTYLTTNQRGMNQAESLQQQIIPDPLRSLWEKYSE